MDSYGSDIENLSSKEARAMKKLITKFVKSYAKKDESVSDKEWLQAQFKEEFPEMSDEETAQWAAESVESIAEYDRDLKSLDEAAAKGCSKEQWFARRVSEASVGVSAIQQGQYLQSIDDALTRANEQMMQTVSTASGAIDQNPQLNGLIAEQHHVSTFNARAALDKSPYRAEARGSQAKDSVDVVIKDTKTGKIVHRYQMKYGKDAKATIRYIKDGNYSNQRIVVPPEQVEEVQKAFPNKTIVSEIGGTDEVPTHSDPLTKEQALEKQEKVQKTGSFDELDWNSFSSKETTLAIGRNAGLLGLQAGVVAGGFTLAKQVIDGDGIDTEEVVKTALTTGADAGLKTAVTGAVKAGVEKGVIKVIPKGTPAGNIAQFVAVTIESVKIFSKVATGELTMSQGMDRMGRTTTAMVCGMAVGSAVGAGALSWIPVVGPLLGSHLGGMIGGMVGYMAGSKFGAAVYDGAKKIRGGISSAIKSAWNTLHTTGHRIRTAVTY